MVSKLQDDCFRSRHCNHVQDQNKVEGVVPASGPSYQERKGPSPNHPQQNSPRFIGKNCVRRLPFASGEVQALAVASPFSVVEVSKGEEIWKRALSQPSQASALISLHIRPIKSQEEELPRAASPSSKVNNEMIQTLSTQGKCIS